MARSCLLEYFAEGDEVSLKHDFQGRGEAL